MTAERRVAIRKEITSAFVILSTLEVVADHLTSDPDVEELRAVHVLLTRGLDRIDSLLLAMSADRLADERDDQSHN
jgi:hypothetical protein